MFASGIPITMVGLDVTHKALFTRAHAERLRDAGRAGRFVAELSDFFQAFHERAYGFDGSPIHDAMAVAHVIDPTLVDDAATRTSRSRRSRSSATAAPSSTCAASRGRERTPTSASTSTPSGSSSCSSRG